MSAADLDIAGEAPGDPAIAEYHASRARYIRTITSGAEKRLLDTVGKRRDPLVEEISNLTVLAHARFETYQAALKAYSAKAPGRVKAGAIAAPMPNDRLIAGVDKLYKAALKAAEEYREVENIVKKRKEKLEEMDRRMREQIELVGRDLIAQLETPSGLEAAFKRDPLLGRAYARMQAAEGRRNAVRESLTPAT